MKELLPDGINMVSAEGNVLSIDFDQDLGQEYPVNRKNGIEIAELPIDWNAGPAPAPLNFRDVKADGEPLELPLDYSEEHPFPLSVTSEHMGPAVEIKSRNPDLLLALKGLAHANKMTGLGMTDKVSSTTVPRVEQARINSLRDAQAAFYRAYGYYEMIMSTDDPQELVKIRKEAADAFRDFSKEYASLDNPKSTRNREKQRRILQKANKK